MTREEIRTIVEGITEEQLKAILDIHSRDIGKAKQDSDILKEENAVLKTDKQTLETKIAELSEKSSTAEEYKAQLEALREEIKEKETAEKAAAEDAALTEAITAVFGDRKFASDYARSGLIADMKSEIAKPENQGRGYAEIFESLTKDKSGIFENPNPPADMPGFGSMDGDVSEDAMREIMGLAANKD